MKNGRLYARLLFRHQCSRVFDRLAQDNAAIDRNNLKLDRVALAVPVLPGYVIDPSARIRAKTKRDDSVLSHMYRIESQFARIAVPDGEASRAIDRDGFFRNLPDQRFIDACIRFLLFRGCAAYRAKPASRNLFSAEGSCPRSFNSRIKRGLFGRSASALKTVFHGIDPSPGGQCRSA